MLSNEQQNFLAHYINSSGDFYGVLNQLGLEVVHILAWRKDVNFENAFCDARQNVINFINEENYIIAKRQLNHTLKYGSTTHTVKVEEKEDIEGNAYRHVTKTTKNVGVPMAAINKALEEDSIIKAVNTLASEGILPEPIARKILASANKIQAEIKASFGVDNKEDHLTQQKAIHLIKAAVFGEVEV